MVHTVARQLVKAGVVWPGDENQMLFNKLFLLIRRWSVHGLFGASVINRIAVLSPTRAHLGHGQAAEYT